MEFLIHMHGIIYHIAFNQVTHFTGKEEQKVDLWPWNPLDTFPNISTK
jgi:hypothetical protein